MSNTPISKTRLTPPQLAVREWRRPLRSEPLTRMVEVVNHLLAYHPCLSFKHFFNSPWGTGDAAPLDSTGLRPANNTGFWANPNRIHYWDHAAAGIELDGVNVLMIDQIPIPYTSPYCEALEVIFRYQGHEFNLNPNESRVYTSGATSQNLYSWFFGLPHSLPATLDSPDANGISLTGGNSVQHISSLRQYVDNDRTNAGLSTDDKLTSSLWDECKIALRLKDSSGNIIDPASGSGWAMILKPSTGGLQAGGMGGGDHFPVRALKCVHRSQSPAAEDKHPRALEYGAKAKTGEGLILEIGYNYVRPHDVTVSEIRPSVLPTGIFVNPPLFPASFPTNQPTQNESTTGGVQEIYLYSGHLYIRFTARANATNGIVFFPEPPTSSWPFSGMGLSASAVSGNSDFDTTACASDQFEYQGACYGDAVGGELTRIGGSASGFSGTPSPGNNSTQNTWAIQPSSNTEWDNMGEMVLQNGGQVWHSALGNWPNDIVVVSSNQPYSIEDSGRVPTGTEKAFVRIPISSITAWGGSISTGDAKGATAFAIYDSTTTKQGEIYHAQESQNGPAGMLNDFFGLGASAGTINILENTVNLDAVKAEFDSMGVD
tara:strand:- start:6349 stop:8151 length:1803 start_codon:yes stop_codon:yes gene_type:complete